MHSEAKPSKATQAVILELALRYPCPVNTDPDRYAARLDLLARDCATMAPSLLRKACDRMAVRSRFLPTAAELHDAAREIVEERQRAQEHAEHATPEAASLSRLETQLIEQNRRLIEQGAHHRWVADNGSAKAVTIELPVFSEPDRYGCRAIIGHRPARDATCNGDGTVTFVWERNAQ